MIDGLGIVYNQYLAVVTSAVIWLVKTTKSGTWAIIGNIST